MPTTAVELPYPNADIVKLPSMIMPKKLGFFIHQNMKKVGFFLGRPGSPPTTAKKQFGPWVHVPMCTYEDLVRLFGRGFSETVRKTITTAK